MNVLRLHPRHNFRLSNEHCLFPTQNKSLLHVKSVGIFSSDLHRISDIGIGDARLNHPLVSDLEFAMVTESCEYIAVDRANTCGKCELCANGHPNLYPEVQFRDFGSMEGLER